MYEQVCQSLRVAFESAVSMAAIRRGQLLEQSASDGHKAHAFLVDDQFLMPKRLCHGDDSLLPTLNRTLNRPLNRHPYSDTLNRPT